MTAHILGVLQESCKTYGFGDRHCQKLYGLETPSSPSLAPAKGMCDSPPFDDGAGLWSNATFSRTNWMVIIMKDCMRREVSNFAPG